MNPLFLQIFRFGIVGVLAAAAHFTIVILLVQTKGLHPLMANVFAFLIAFQVSYWGHRKWTFNETTTVHYMALSKLLMVQLTSFAANELLFSIFLGFHISYVVALFIVLTILPIFTFVSSKFWVFS